MRKSIHSDAQLYFAELLVKARKRAGLTQVQLAERIGRPQSFVSKYEAGERRLDVVEFIGLARALDADPVAFVRRLIRTMAL